MIKEFKLKTLPMKWDRLNTILERGEEGAYDCHVIGDPCVVWDETLQKYRMFYFGQNHIEGKEINQSACAVSKSATEVGPGDWEKIGLIKYTNPEIVGYDAHKAWVVIDAGHPNIPAKINGEYWIFQAVYRGGHNKKIMVCKSKNLEGPWTIQEEYVLDLGGSGEFDEYNCDSPTAYWFKEKQKILIFYKGYPAKPQRDQPVSPLGSGLGAAEMSPGDKVAVKFGKILAPCVDSKHWASGWISTPNIFKAAKGGWYGFLNGAVNEPAPVEMEPAMREPAPSYGGWIYTPEEYPVKGWDYVQDRPVEWIDEIPEDARKEGEGTSFWKHNILVHPGNKKMYLYYHSGSYGHERLFGKVTGLKY